MHGNSLKLQAPPSRRHIDRSSSAHRLSNSGRHSYRQISSSTNHVYKDAEYDDPA